MLLKKDTFGAILEHQVNTSPVEGGVLRKASYCAHEGRMYVSHEDANRAAILKENAELYKQRKGDYKNRKDTAGGYPMTIPPTDYADLYKDNPWLSHCSREDKMAFFIRLYKSHPEYRIG